MQSYNDTIRIIGLKFVGSHGVDQSEYELPQPFEVDVELKLDLSRAAESDDLTDTVDYAGVTDVVHEVINSGHRCLIEKLAGLIIERLESLIHKGEVTVRIRKPRAPLTIPFETVEVELKRILGQ